MTSLLDIAHTNATELYVNILQLRREGLEKSQLTSDLIQALDQWCRAVEDGHVTLGAERL